jgi:hypothetical protein
VEGSANIIVPYHTNGPKLNLKKAEGRRDVELPAAVRAPVRACVLPKKSEAKRALLSKNPS